MSVEKVRVQGVGDDGDNDNDKGLGRLGDVRNDDDGGERTRGVGS
jgi:hypothetical protein